MWLILPVAIVVTWLQNGLPWVDRASAYADRLPWRTLFCVSAVDMIVFFKGIVIDICKTENHLLFLFVLTNSIIILCMRADSLIVNHNRTFNSYS